MLCVGGAWISRGTDAAGGYPKGESQPYCSALCCVCVAVVWWCLLLFAAVLCAVVVLGCLAVRCQSSRICAVLCCAVLVCLPSAVPVVCAVPGFRCYGVLLCVLLLPVVCCGAALGVAVRGCLLVAGFRVAVPVWRNGLIPCGWCDLLRCPAPLRCALWCCAVVCCCAVMLRCAFAALFVFVVSFLFEKPLQNPQKYFSPLFSVLFFEIKQKYTQSNTPASSKTMYASVTYLLPLALDVHGLVLVLGVLEIVGVHC